MTLHRAAHPTLLTGATIAALLAGGAAAEPPAEPFALTPSNAPGLTTGYLQPQGTNQARIGTRQPTESQAGTGTQVYDGGITFRGYWPYQLGFDATVFDDPPNQPINGSTANLTLGSFEIDGKYVLFETPRMGVAIEGSLAYLRYDVEDGESEGLVGGTLALPATYRLTDRIFLNGEIGVTALPDEIGDNPGFGTRGFAAIGLGFQPTDRLFLYGSVKALFRNDEAGPEGDEDTLYTLGARYALTPQLAANAYLTNGYADTPVLDDLGFFLDRDETVFGAALTYVPSGQRFNIPRYGSDVPAVDRELVFGDGITLMGPQTIGSNEMRVELGGGSSGNARLATYISPDPDFQVEAIFEDYALDETSGFRNEEIEDKRYSVGIRYQALSEAEGDPVSLGARVLFGRDFEEPTVGVLFAEGSLRKELGQRVELTLNPKAATYGDEELYAGGLGVGYDVSERLQLIGEAIFGGSDLDEPVYAVGLRRSFPEALSAIDIYATNASGRSGIGSMLAGEPQIGFTLTWQPPFRAF